MRRRISRNLSTTALWIVAVKYAGLRDLLSEMQEANISNPVLFVQNGIGHMELVKDMNFHMLHLRLLNMGTSDR